MDDEFEIGYDVRDWTSEARTRLFATLDSLGVPFSLTGNEVGVRRVDEVRVDAVVTAIDGRPPSPVDGLPPAPMWETPPVAGRERSPWLIRGAVIVAVLALIVAGVVVWLSRSSGSTAVPTLTMPRSVSVFIEYEPRPDAGAYNSKLTGCIAQNGLPAVEPRGKSWAYLGCYDPGHQTAAWSGSFVHDCIDAGKAPVFNAATNAVECREVADVVAR